MKRHQPAFKPLHLIPVLLLTFCAGEFSQLAYADPPSWAPAHGWRKKNDPNYIGYTGKKWDNDYGIIEGTCNREAVGAAIGSVVGGAIGSQIGQGNGRTIATILGAVAGAVIGSNIARDMDNTDRACLGHTLELMPANQRVTWLNPTSGVKYTIIPDGGYSANHESCRSFTSITSYNGHKETKKANACRTGDGVWELAKR